KASIPTWRLSAIIRRGPHVGASRMHLLERALLALAFAFALAVSALAQTAGPQGGEGRDMREQDWRVPTATGSNLMDTTVFRPPGTARAPLVVINHGSPADGSQRTTMKRIHYTGLSSYFVSRGYVVALPLRRGYGATGGGWAEEYGSCKNPDYF